MSHSMQQALAADRQGTMSDGLEVEGVVPAEVNYVVPPRRSYGPSRHRTSSKK